MRRTTTKILIQIFVFLLLVASAQAITVQRGETTITTTTLNVTVNEFNPENTFVLLSTRSSSDLPNNLLITPKIVNETTFELRRYGTTSTDVRWEVIEWSETTVQENNVSFGPTDDIITVDISSVSLDNSFIIAHSRLNSGTASELIRGQFATRFHNETRIQFTRLVDGTAGEIYWQVISLADATIQSGNVTITGTTSTQTIDAINTSRALLLTSTTSDNTGLARYSVRAQIHNSTAVRFDRTNTADNVHTEYFVIEHPQFLAQRGQTTVSGSSPVTQSISSVSDLEKTFMYATWDSTGTGTANADAFITYYLSSTSQLTFEKGTASQTNVHEWQVIEIMPLSLFPEPTPGIVPFYCIFRADSECLAEETLVLRAGNDSGGFDNAHVQHANQTPIYTNTLCCNAQSPYVLNNTCASEDTQVVASIDSLHDAHIQIPPEDNYPYDVCFGSTFGNFSCTAVNGTCDAGYTGLFSLSSSESNDGAFNYTNAHIAEPDHYLLNVCCKIETTTPLTPELLYPADGNDTVFERNVTLQWSEPFEPDGDDIEYDVQLNVTAGACSVEHDETNLTTNNFTTNELCVDQLYTWSVRACDVDGCSEWAEPFNFTIASTLGLTFINNQTTFASLIPGQTNDTEAGPGAPLHIQNTGNIVSDLELNATAAIFENAGLDTEFFQFRVAEETPSSYVSATETYTNVTSSLTTIITGFNYVVGNDEALIHLRVTVPDLETPGERSTTLVARVSAS